MQMQKLVVAGAAVLALAACGGGAQESAESMPGASAPAEAAAVDPGITSVGVLHINIADMDRSLAWYQGVLGMDTVRDSGGPSPTTNVAEAGAMMHTHVLKTPDDGFSMELVEVSGVEVRPQSPSVQDPGAIMLALVVADLDAVLAGARRLGLTVISDGGDVVVTEERGRQAMVRDADGVVSYLSQASAPDAAVVHHDFTFLSADDLDRTVAFYNGVFGLGLDAPGDLNPTP
ncbi:MAG: VOC family protein [Vicinamibacterales bacterium]